MARVTFPPGSVLAAMLGEAAPLEARRAARRLRAEGVPALAIDEDVADLALGLASTEAACSAAVLAVVPPLFWLEARQAGWVVEAKRDGLAVRGFRVGEDGVPEASGAMLVRFGAALPPEDEATLYLRGLLTAVSLPELLAQMGESSPVSLAPADAPARDAGLMRGLKLIVASTTDS